MAHGGWIRRPRIGYQERTNLASLAALDALQVLASVLDNRSGLRADLNDARALDPQRTGYEAQAAEELRLRRLRLWQSVPNVLRANDAGRQVTVDVREARRAE